MGEDFLFVLCGADHKLGVAPQLLRVMGEVPGFTPWCPGFNNWQLQTSAVTAIDHVFRPMGV